MYVVTTRDVPDHFEGESDKMPAGAIGWIAATTLAQAKARYAGFSRGRVILSHVRADGTLWVGSVAISALREADMFETTTAKALQYRLPSE